MKITIVGDGKVGDSLIAAISAEGHSITVIDINSAAVENVVNRFDVMGIVGNGASYDTQKEAKVSANDLFIAVTFSDETNMLSCIIAKKIGARHTIARVRNPEYYRSTYFLAKQLGIDMIINPEAQMAHEIARLLRFPAVNRIEAFSKGRVDLVQIKIGSDHPLVGKKLSDLEKLTGVRVLVCTVMRNDEAIIPKGDFTIAQGDEIGVAASQATLSVFFDKLGLITKKVKRVMIIGGGKSAYYLAERLGKIGIRTRIVELDENRCRELSELLPDASIIHGNGIESEMLLEEGIDDMDAVVTLTGTDELNVVLSLFAHNRGVEKVITKIAKINFTDMLETVGIDTVVSPRTVTSDSVLRYLRGIANSMKGDRASGNVVTLYKLCENKAEALEFDVTPKFNACGIPLKDLKLRKNILIASIVRGDSVIIPGGHSTIEPGDSVVIVTADEQLCDLNEILAK
jgi:trk system potassium uptake protein TrkA